MRLEVGWRCFLVGACAALLAGAASPSAKACGGPAPRAPIGVPRSGASGVSTATSIIVLSQGQPAGLTLQAAGQDVPLAPAVSLGAGADGLVGGLSFWQVRAATADGLLPPSAEQVLTAQFQGGAVEVTRFTTAAGYDKVAGTAPVARSVHLWRVRYPVSEINSGDCVFAEYHGFLTVDYEPGTVPNTPAASVVHTFQLTPKTGGSAQTFSYVGDTPFTGLEPTGDHPLPLGAWQPELDPSREYCLGISAFGDGDIARLPLTSEAVCANVVEISSAGAPPSGGSTGGGGCAVAGTTAPASAARRSLVRARAGAPASHQVSLTSWRRRPCPPAGRAGTEPVLGGSRPRAYGSPSGRAVASFGKRDAASAAAIAAPAANHATAST